MYKIQNFNWISSILFHFIHDLPFSPGHLLESEERFVNLFCNFSPLCGSAPHFTCPPSFWLPVTPLIVFLEKELDFFFIIIHNNLKGRCKTFVHKMMCNIFDFPDNLDPKNKHRYCYNHCYCYNHRYSNSIHRYCYNHCYN